MLGRPSHIKGYDELPAKLRSLIEESFVLLDRIIHLDRALSPGQNAASLAPAPNEVGAQILRLHRAFGQN